jgi:paraquat-inducible protein B
MPENVRMQLASVGITGVKFLQLDFYDTSKNPTPALEFPTPTGYVASAPSTMTSLERSLGDTLERLPVVADRATAVLERIERMLASVEERDLVGRVAKLVDLASSELEQLDARNVGVELAAAIADAHALIARTQEVVTELGGDDGPVHALLARLDGVASKLEQAIADAELGATAASVRAATGSVAGAGRGVSRLSDDLRGELAALRDATRAIQSLAELLEREPAALLHGKSAAEGQR